MHPRWRRLLSWALAWAGLVLVGGTALVRWDIAQRRDAFQTDARVVHRLLSQRVAEVDATLATLSLLDPFAQGAADAAQRLPALHPPVQRVLRRTPGQAWPDAALAPALAVAEQVSARERRAALGPFDAAARRYAIVLAGTAASHALIVDLDRLVPRQTWPFPPDAPVRVELRRGEVGVTLQDGAGDAARPAGLTPGFVFTKTLDSPSQPFEVAVRQWTGPAQWPWAALAVAAVAAAGVLAAAAAWLRQREERRRAEELLRLGRVARLNTWGEMAAGIAHELSQPLAAVLGNVQAARRHLEEVAAGVATVDAGSDTDDLRAAREALAQAVAQARRATDVVQRLRRSVERRDADAAVRPVALDAVVRDALHLLEPQVRRQGVHTSLAAEGVQVLADPVALEQIVHNLLLNALQALEGVPPAQRRLEVQVSSAGAQGVLVVADRGPGIATEMLPRLFMPFATDKPGGLGLGLSLSETLAAGLGGSLTARNRDDGGAAFRLALPLAGTGSGG